MITGHNTDIEYAGSVYHVQTEDRGCNNPLIETLIYSRGEILDSIRTDYSETIENGYDEKDVIRLIEEQHHRCVREVRNGKYDPEGPKPFGYNIITNRSFDEVIMDTLASGMLGSALAIELLEEVHFYEMAQASLKLRVSKAEDASPASEATVNVRLVRKSGKPMTLFTGTTDEGGELAVHVDVPDLEGTEGIVVVQADSGGPAIEIRQPVLAPVAV